MLCFVCLFWSESSFAQWKKLFDFGRKVNVIFFKENTPTPTNGFVGLEDIDTKSDKLWHTIDGGITWQISTMTFIPSQGYGTPLSLTFKDSLEGWFCNWHTPSSIYRTTDGGSTWNDIFYDPGTISSSIYYVKSTKLLICAGETPREFPFLYSTDGLNFKHGPSNAAFNGSVGLSFSDDFHGILCPPTPGAGTLPMAYTQDGGITWNRVDSGFECYSPIGISNTSTFFALSEFGERYNKILRSDDGGINWREVYSYPIHLFPDVTGAMQVGSGMSLFFQTSSPGSEGIMVSFDTGRTFASLCGPINGQDTRFFVRDSFIYAGDSKGGLWLNTTGIGSNSIPQLSNINFTFNSNGCHPIDTTIIITFFDSCNGVQGDLKNISLFGSSQFSVIGNNNIRKLHQDDSLIVRFDPTINGNGNAKLHLTFHLGFKDFDTTISLTGVGSYKQPFPQISTTDLNLKPLGCKSIDSVLTLTFFDSCNGIQADLKDISLLSDGKFSIISGGTTRQLHENDSIVVRYDPQASGSDTAFLKLTFHLGFKDFDTTVLLTGLGGNGAGHVMFSMGMGDSSITGLRVGIPIYPDVTLSGIGLTSVTFNLTYNGDLLGQPECASGSPYNSICSIGNEIVNGKTTTLPVTITGSDISLDHLTPLASITFTSYLTDTNSTRIVMTNLKLNDGDPDYAQCVLSADTTSTSYKEIYRCTEPTLQQFLKTKTVLFITSMRPNPAEDNITVEVQSGIEQNVVVKVIDALGVEVKNLVGHFLAGSNKLVIDMSGESSGVYVLQLGEISTKFVVKK
jgi:hypothetical protein